MIYEPMAAAIGIGMDVEAPQGNMVVDIGGGTTEIAVISLGGTVVKSSVRTAGDDFTNDIVEYMRRQHNIRVGERTAEAIKINVGAAIPELDNPPAEYIVRGPHQMTALPLEIPVSHQEIAHRVVCRHIYKRYIPHRWRCFAERSRQASVRQDKYPCPCIRRPAACSSSRYWHCFEEC